jgi:hypothetical protein
VQKQDELESPVKWLNWLFKGIPAQTRLRIVACVGFLLACYSYAFVLGVTPWFKGFARAEMLDEISLQIKDIRISQAESSISELRAQECHTSNPQTRQFFAQLLSKRLAWYQRMSGTQFQVPDCKDE